MAKLEKIEVLISAKAPDVDGNIIAKSAFVDITEHVERVYLSHGEDRVDPINPNITLNLTIDDTMFRRAAEWFIVEFKSVCDFIDYQHHLRNRPFFLIGIPLLLLLMIWVTA